MPPNAVYVGRGSRFGNDFVIGRDGTREECIRKYAEAMLPYTHHGPRNGLDDFLISNAVLEDMIATLRGKDLACWCRLDEPCHADLLLAWVNCGIDETGL